ncbi:MAG: helix-hairpin-helix domain-containing protein [Pseudomonadota bacterium]
MLMTLIFIIALLTLYFIIKSKKQSNQTFTQPDVKRNTASYNAHLMDAQPSRITNNFSPVKIVENDNELEKIVPNFHTRRENKIVELTDSLGKALPNDVIWGILQDLILEYILKDHKIYINTFYQQGLLLQKEKKYKQAITHYSYGLYYLMNFYKADFNPTSHIIDLVRNEIQLIEMAQYKFINKIQICMKKEELTVDEVKDLSYKLIKNSSFPYLNFEQFFVIIEPHIRLKNKVEFEEGTIGSLQDKPLSEWIRDNDDIISGLEFNATLQLRTPLEVLIHHGEVFSRKEGRPPQYAKEAWQGIWTHKLKSWKEIDPDLDCMPELPFGTTASDIGSLEPDEVKEYLDFLIKFHTIAESDLTADEKIKQIKQLEKSDSNFRAYYKKQSKGDKEFLESYFNLLIKNILPPKVTKSLNDTGYRILKDLKGVDPKELLKLEGVGKATIDKLVQYL